MRFQLRLHNYILTLWYSWIWNISHEYRCYIEFAILSKICFTIFLKTWLLKSQLSKFIHGVFRWVEADSRDRLCNGKLCRVEKVVMLGFYAGAIANNGKIKDNLLQNTYIYTWLNQNLWRRRRCYDWELELWSMDPFLRTFDG